MLGEVVEEGLRSGGFVGDGNVVGPACCDCGYLFCVSKVSQMRERPSNTQSQDPQIVSHNLNNSSSFQPFEIAPQTIRNANGVRNGK